MYVIEVIRLRLATAQIDEIVDRIYELAARLELGEINIYRHAIVDVDLSIHLHHPDTHKGARFDGQTLSTLLKEYGLVNYSRWEEIFEKEKPKKSKGENHEW